ncbi:hypothetical protein Ahy_B06g081705 [Arachis hypogaea]|uniref:Iron hydrogenase large subunit C-terminal domain-containing protein n=1 Tax=Arachis hypogaea TaxID=3818 RepID=A0A444YLU9_ARAHY|nr:hypothetical protein Ahy_B06g081705 [Arachis hypogaea]
MGLSPEEIYHVTVRPCYDKILETTSDDFVIQLESHDERSGNEDNMVTEVDSVLTTGDFVVFVKKFRCDALSCRLTNINKEGYRLWGPRKLWRLCRNNFLICG